MSIVKINAIEVPEGAGAELEKRFAARAGAVEHAEGFEGFQLLRPTEGEKRYFVMTWWESEDAFQGWMTSSDFAKGHAGAGGRPAGAGEERGAPAHGGDAPVSTGSSLLSFEVVEQIPAPGA